MKQFIRDVWSLSAPYWKSREKASAWLLLVTVISMTLGQVYLNVRFNEWNNGFYDALQNLDEPAFWKALRLFCILAFFYIVNGVYRQYLGQMLQIRWRRWLTDEYLDDWLKGQTYYRMQVAGHATDNPDQRISEDIDQFIGLTFGLTLGLLNAGVTLFSFVAILWGLSGDLPVHLPAALGGAHVTVPGYMVWAAVLYAAAGTWLTSKIGRPLIRLNYSQQMFEADFRFSMARLRENSEGVAFYKGEAQEKHNFLEKFSHVFENYWAIMKRQKALSWFTIGYGQIANIFPFLVTAPRFFAKQIKLGGMMQTASAFGHVQGSLSFIVDAYTNIATWKAVVERLGGFTRHINETVAQAAHEQSFRPGFSDTGLALKDLTVKLPDGKVLLEKISTTVKPGEALLIRGPSGCGKSTLLRTIAGIWPFATGQALAPAHEKSLFLPQRPYLPIDTLRAALCYPDAPEADDETINFVLRECGLGHLEEKLDERANWAQILSLGEQQRVGFARALLTKRDCLFLDEATSALDGAAEAKLYTLLRHALPKSVIVSVGHRDTLSEWHEKSLALGA
ncbi:MAG: ATP-binding cassette domain-containing protein [Alphaproteobacteria bacterium]|nr:ATP-binding cassette domain-containing protein [Alphaproteobacteria bacterium]